MQKRWDVAELDNPSLWMRMARNDERDKLARLLSDLHQYMRLSYAARSLAHRNLLLFIFCFKQICFQQHCSKSQRPNIAVEPPCVDKVIKNLTTRHKSTEWAMHACMPVDKACGAHIPKLRTSFA